MDHRRAEISGVLVWGIDQKGLIDQVLEWVKQKEHRTLTYVNAHCLNLVVDDPCYRDLLNQTDLVYADGIGAVWAGRLAGYRGLHKVTGRSWIAELCRRGEQDNLRLYLLGGKPGVAERAGQVLTHQFSRLKLCGTADGFFRDKTEGQVLAEINAFRTQVLLVGMGVPAQEYWVAKNRPQIPAEICWSVGALFDYLAGLEKPVPGWLERVGMEWVWRLTEDPKGKWRRYIIGIPRFVVRVISQSLKKR